MRHDAERFADILDAAQKIAAKVRDGQAAFMQDENVNSRSYISSK